MTNIVEKTIEVFEGKTNVSEVYGVEILTDTLNSDSVTLVVSYLDNEKGEVVELASQLGIEKEYNEMIRIKAEQEAVAVKAELEKEEETAEGQDYKDLITTSAVNIVRALALKKELTPEDFYKLEPILVELEGVELYVVDSVEKGAYVSAQLLNAFGGVAFQMISTIAMITQQNSESFVVLAFADASYPSMMGNEKFDTFVEALYDFLLDIDTEEEDDEEYDYDYGYDEEYDEDEEDEDDYKCDCGCQDCE